MPLDVTASEDALFARADKAIADAIVIRAEVGASLAAARLRRPTGPLIERSAASEATWLKLSAAPGWLDVWCSVARAFADAGEIVWEPDAELERAWQSILPTIQTPLTLFQG